LIAEFFSANFCSQHLEARARQTIVSIVDRRFAYMLPRATAATWKSQNKMRVIKRLAATLPLLALLSAMLQPLPARTRKGDRLLAQGKLVESRKDWDAALELYEQALSEDPTDAAYQLSVARARFQAATTHINQGFKARQEGNLTQALLQFQKAFQIDPSLSMAQQEVRRTQQMIEREKKKAQEPGMTPEKLQAEAGLTPAQVEKKREDEKLATILSVPELKPLNQQPINLILRNQTPRVLFETVGKLAGINVLFDPDFLTQSTKAQSVEFNNSTLDQALDYLSLVTKSFWKPISPNTIFVTQDNTTKRRDYEEQVMKVFYLNNVNQPQELQEILTTVRSVADLQRLFVYNAQNAIIARGEADRIALAEKIINDLDKPKSEVVVDVIVMEADRTRSRDIATAVAQGGLNIPITWTPGGKSTTTTTTPADGSSPPTTTTTTTTPTATSAGIPLSNLHISTHDYSVTLPGGLLQLLMSDSNTRILQSPQVRAVDGFKANLKIGQKVPTATGSFQPGIGGVGINPLVNTQFTFIDVGVIVDLLPKIHDNGEVSMHVEVEISSVNGHVSLGGIDQPIIGQRKVIHDIRMKEGEINLLGGLMQMQETKTVTGVPGLSSIPLIRRLFTSESLTKDSSELVIALVPHIVRKAEITAENLRTIAVGNQTVVKLNYAPRTPPPAEQKPGQAPRTEPAAAAPATPPPVAVVTPPAAEPATPVTPAIPEAAPPVKPPETAPPAKPATPTTQPTAAFSPPQAQTQMGGAVTLTLVVNDVKSLFSAPLTVHFDPKVLRLQDATRGDLLQSDNTPQAFTKNIQNDTGDAAIGMSRFFGRPGINGSGTLVTLVFQAVGTGSTTITLPQFTPRDAQGQPIEIKAPQATVTVR
jgi:general secretion pathway protein D